MADPGGLTADDLKRALAAQGVTLPPSGYTGQETQAAPSVAGIDEERDVVRGRYRPPVYLKPVDISGPTEIPKPETTPVFHQPDTAQAQDDSAQAPPRGYSVTVPARTIPLVSPATRLATLHGEQTEFEGEDQQAKWEAFAQDELADEKTRQDANLRIQYLLNEAERKKQRANLDDHLAQLQARADMLREDRVDPDHFFASKSTGEHIQLGIAAFLGGLAQGALGTPTNHVADMIRGRIHDDIDAQKDNMAHQVDLLGQDRNLYQEKMALFGNDEQARAATMQEELNAALRAIDEMADRYKSPVTLARAEVLKGQLERQYAKEWASMEQYVPERQVQVGPASGAGDVESDVKPEEVVHDPFGNQWVTVPAQRRDAVQGRFDEAQSVHAARQDLEELLAHAKHFSPQWQGRLAATLKTLAMANVPATGAGGHGGVAFLQLTQKAVGSPMMANIAPDRVLGAAREVDASAQGQARAALDAEAQHVVRPGLVVRKEKGQQVQKRNYAIVGPYQRRAAVSASAPPGFAPAR